MMDVPYNLYAGDAMEYLARLEDGSVDLMIMDSPYPSLEKWRSTGTTTRLSHSKGSSNDWFQVFSNEDYPRLMVECFRVLKTNSHLYSFSDFESLSVIREAAETAGFKFWKPIVWDKIAIGMGYHYRARYELISFFEKGKRRLNSLSTPDVLAFRRLHSKKKMPGGRKVYPAEKPVDLLRVLVAQSSMPGELVCDPFMGSGSTGVAAVLEGRSFSGSDIDSAAVDLANTRLKEIT